MEKKLKLSEVRKELPFKTHQVNLFWNLGDIIESKRVIDFDVYLPTRSMNLQRPFCWNLDQKQQLILSILRGIYIPKLAILVDAGSEERVYQIIDGKQRLNAMISFIKGEFPISINGVDYCYWECEKDIQNEIRCYSPVCEAAYFYPGSEISDDDKIQWFEQINFTGTPQDVEHLNKLKQ